MVTKKWTGDAFDQVLPYTYGRLMRILEENGMKAENVLQGYKANRQKGYCEQYRIIRLLDGKTVVNRITLNGLRQVFSWHGFPLEDSKSMTNKKKY